MIEKLEGHRSSVNCLAVANHYQKLLIAAGAEDGSVRVWDMSNGRVVMGIHGFADSSSDEITSIAFFENNLYASAGTSVFQFEIGHAGPTVKTSPDSRFDRVVKDEINQMSFQRLGEDVAVMAIADDSGSASVFDLSNGKMFASQKHKNLCTAVTFRPNNHRELWSGGMDCTVIAREFPTANSLNSWDFANDAAGSSTPSINPPFVYSLKFTPDGDALAVGRGDGGISFIEFLKHTATTPASSAASKKSSNKKKKKRKALNDVYVVSKTAADDGEVMKQDSRRIVEECRLKGALKEFPRSVKATSTRELNLVDVIHGWSIVAIHFPQSIGTKNDEQDDAKLLTSRQYMVSGSIDGTIALWETSRERIEVAWRHDLSVKMGRSLSTPPPILLASVNCGKKINDLISVMPSGDNITVNCWVLKMERNFLTILQSVCYTVIDTIKSLITSLSPTANIIINGRRFKPIRKLGEGGFSYVFLVKSISDGTEYALKRIRVQLPEHEKRLLDEIKAHQSVDSSHVLKLVDSTLVKRGVVVEEGLLLLPFYNGGTIQDMINKKTFIPMDRILKLAIDICRGLEAFHSRSPPLAFRDLKPDNVLIDAEGRGILMDLGSVTQARVNITSRREALQLQELCAETCTAPYRPPELFEPPSSCVITETTDVWSLGCTIYAMAYKESPFDGSMTSAIGGKIPSPPVKDTYDTAFRSLIEGILVSDHTKRPSVIQVRSRLEAMLAKQSETGAV